MRWLTNRRGRRISDNRIGCCLFRYFLRGWLQRVRKDRLVWRIDHLYVIYHFLIGTIESIFQVMKRRFPGIMRLKGFCQMFNFRYWYKVGRSYSG
jgi:hypothetical protein